MFGQTMQTVEKDAIQSRLKKESQLNKKISGLMDELEQVLKHAKML